ncbi:DUF2798 domain-containing protein [Nitrosomonas sp.]|uniref:DUF2798 domain-containing protein n=1 Tax=Nitrosomonas sp. TaxID=42353 RepID=UPI0026146E29|nr:DUF2798 domain-containing protein [Nitrosomonas sp.]
MQQKILTHCIYCLMMSATMTGCVSATVTAVNLGFSDAFINEWLYSWSIAFPIGFALLLLLSPLFRRIVDSMIR